MGNYILDDGHDGILDDVKPSKWLVHEPNYEKLNRERKGGKGREEARGENIF